MAGAPPGTLRRRWLAAAGCLTAAAVLFTGQVRADFWYIGRQLSWLHAFAVSLADWELWTLAAPAVLALSARVPVSRRRLAPALVVHIPASLVFAFVKFVAATLLIRFLTGNARIPFGLTKLYLDVLVYWAIVAAVHYADQARLSRERDLTASRLETELARAQVDALRMQLHPHFLFNTLNTISGLMREDVEAADVMLTQLSDLFRATLQNEGRHQVALSEEIDWLRTYMAIQETRYGPRLTFEIHAEADCQGALVPTLILQPLVENAIRHGVSVTPGRGRISIRAHRNADRLRIDVDDDGAGVVEPVREGYGLRNTRSRLRVLYGERASLVVGRRESATGTRSRIDLPFSVTVP